MLIGGEWVIVLGRRRPPAAVLSFLLSKQADSLTRCRAFSEKSPMPPHSHATVCAPSFLYPTRLKRYNLLQGIQGKKHALFVRRVDPAFTSGRGQAVAQIVRRAIYRPSTVKLAERGASTWRETGRERFWTSLTGGRPTQILRLGPSRFLVFGVNEVQTTQHLKHFEAVFFEGGPGKSCFTDNDTLFCIGCFQTSLRDGISSRFRCAHVPLRKWHSFKMPSDF
ncbi:hypothetical protein GWK47_031529 [Chionoecetes opilio]|uniref:Uncharacterized protein n=1 Tax=Chionoecetes opilio TaxID=41210 RepID=A0A8J5CQJ6_CHIOP|nr:hypothetical protein GWK47_031529 [Chionoecetes opilio]